MRSRQTGFKGLPDVIRLVQNGRQVIGGHDFKFETQTKKTKYTLKVQVWRVHTAWSCHFLVNVYLKSTF